jgi:hypothetical protein
MLGHLGSVSTSSGPTPRTVCSTSRPAVGARGESGSVTLR